MGKWGGSNFKEKVSTMRYKLFNYFLKNHKQYEYQIEKFLHKKLIFDFNIVAEDNSPKQVAYVLICLYNELKENEFSTLNFVRSLRTANAKKSRKNDISIDNCLQFKNKKFLLFEKNCYFPKFCTHGSNKTTTHAIVPIIDSDGFTLESRRK